MARRKVWEVAEACFANRGWQRASASAERYVGQILRHDDGLAEPRMGDITYLADTHARSGEFSEMLSAAERKIKKAAKGRKIFWLADPNREWHDVRFVFGDDHEERLAKLAADIRKERRNRAFRDSLTPRQRKAFGKLFGGEECGRYAPHSNPVWYERKDGWQLWFRGHGTYGPNPQFPDENPCVVAKRYDISYARSHGHNYEPKEQVFLRTRQEIRDWIADHPYDPILAKKFRA